jgi:hypothetical protein
VVWKLDRLARSLRVNVLADWCQRCPCRLGRSKSTWRDGGAPDPSLLFGIAEMEYQHSERQARIAVAKTASPGAKGRPGQTGAGRAFCKVSRQRIINALHVSGARYFATWPLTPDLHPHGRIRNSIKHKR